MFSQKSKQEFIAAARELHRGFLIIDLLKRLQEDPLENPSVTLKRFFPNQEIPNTTGDKFEFTLKGNKSTTPLNGNKAVADYNEEEQKEILAGHTIKFEKNSKGEWKPAFVINYIGQKVELGGKDRMDLNSLHTDNLGKFFEHLGREKRTWKEFFTFQAKPNVNVQNLLVQLTTGAGKTFTQALLIMTLRLANLNGVFLIPDHLLANFKTELSRIMPDDFFTNDSIYIGGVKEALNPEKTNDIYKKIEKKDPKNTLLVIDEAHELDVTETMFKKAKSLAGKFLSVFLTATPSTALDKISQGEDKITSKKLKSIAIMSQAQKEKQKYTAHVDIQDIHTKGRAEMEVEAGVGIIKRSVSGIKRFLARLVDVDPNHNLAAASINALMYGIRTLDCESAKAKDDKEFRNLVHTKISPSIFNGKTLIHATDYESIVNIDRILMDLSEINSFDDIKPKINEPTDTQSEMQMPNYLIQDPYSSKYQNLFSTKDTSSFLMFSEDHNTRTAIDYQKALNRKFRDKLEKEIKALARQSGYTPTKDEVKKLQDETMQQMFCAPLTNSMHGTLDLALSIILGYEEVKNDSKEPFGKILQDFGTIELNKRRAKDLNGLIKTLSEKAAQITDFKELTKIIKESPTNTKGLDDETATQVATIVLQVAIHLKNTSEVGKKEEIVNNYHSSLKPLETIDKSIQALLFDLAKRNFKLYFFKDVEQNETIRDDEVFTGFDEVSYRSRSGEVIERNGVRKKATDEKEFVKPKDRDKRDVERLNPNSREYRYDPTVPQKSLTMEQATNLSRAGICSFLVTNQRIFGYNDVNLRNVITMIPSPTSILAKAENVIQSLRNRALDFNKAHNFIIATPRGVFLPFGAKELNKDDYTKDFLEAPIKQKPIFIKALGQEMGEGILKWIKANADLHHNINDNELIKEIQQIALEKLELINKKNAYEFKLTEKDFAQVLCFAIERMKGEQHRFKSKATLNLFARIADIILNAVGMLLHWMEKRKLLANLQAAKVELTKEEENKIKSFIIKFNKSKEEEKQTYLKLESAEKLSEEDKRLRDLFRRNYNIQDNGISSQLAKSLLENKKDLTEEEKASVKSFEARFDEANRREILAFLILESEETLSENNNDLRNRLRQKYDIQDNEINPQLANLLRKNQKLTEEEKMVIDLVTKLNIQDVWQNSSIIKAGVGSIMLEVERVKKFANLETRKSVQEWQLNPGTIITGYDNLGPQGKVIVDGLMSLSSLVASDDPQEWYYLYQEIEEITKKDPMDQNEIIAFLKTCTYKMRNSKLLAEEEHLNRVKEMLKQAKVLNANQINTKNELIETLGEEETLAVVYNHLNTHKTELQKLSINDEVVISAVNSKMNQLITDIFEKQLLPYLTDKELKASLKYLNKSLNQDQKKTILKQRNISEDVDIRLNDLKTMLDKISKGLKEGEGIKEFQEQYCKVEFQKGNKTFSQPKIEMVMGDLEKLIKGLNQSFEVVYQINSQDGQLNLGHNYIKGDAIILNMRPGVTHFKPDFFSSPVTQRFKDAVSLADPDRAGDLQSTWRQFFMVHNLSTIGKFINSISYRAVANEIAKAEEVADQMLSRMGKEKEPLLGGIFSKEEPKNDLKDTGNKFREELQKEAGQDIKIEDLEKHGSRVNRLRMTIVQDPPLQK